MKVQVYSFGMNNHQITCSKKEYNLISPKTEGINNTLKVRFDYYGLGSMKFGLNYLVEKD